MPYNVFPARFGDLAPIVWGLHFQTSVSIGSSLIICNDWTSSMTTCLAGFMPFSERSWLNCLLLSS